MLLRLLRLGLTGWVLLGCLGAGAVAEQDPALQTASKQLVEAYLRQGPSRAELPDGSASANWAIMQKVGLPELLLQAPLQVGSWATIWAPVEGELEKRGFPGLGPLEAVTWWEETRKEPQRFLRLLVQRGLLDARVPKERKRGIALRDSLGQANVKLSEVRANVRFERAGWSFTGAASLVPGQRVVRLVLRGSQPCPLSGKARTANISLKGRLFEDKGSPDGLKVQLLEHEFASTGCEEILEGRISAPAPLASGGESRVTGSLVVEIKDEIITGRLQVDLAYRPAGGDLQTAHGAFSVRGSLAADGTAHATLTPVSTSGSRLLREALARAGAMEGQIKQGQGAGAISMPVFKQPFSWRATRAK